MIYRTNNAVDFLLCKSVFEDLFDFKDIYNYLNV